MTHIRLAEPRDCDALLSLIHALAAHHGDPPACDRWALMRDVFDMNPHLLVFVAQSDDELIGYTALQRVSQLHWGVIGIDMHHLFVTPKARATGLGVQLVKRAVSHARTIGARFVSVSTAPENAKAQAFYQAQGFERISQDPPRFRLKL